jgi:hypothetical protein
MHGIERDDAVREVEFTEQLLGGWDFVGFVRDIDVREDQTGFDLECVQHLGGLAIVEVVEAAPEGFSIECDDASCRIGCCVAQASGVLTENLLDRPWIEALKDVSNGGMGRCASPAQTEGGIQAAAMHFDEGHDGTIGVAAGHDGKDGEQQNMLQLVEFTLGPARVGDIAEQAEQLIERSHGNLLRIWLPCIDSKNSSRRNRQSGSACTIGGMCCVKDSPCPLVV